MRIIPFLKIKKFSAWLLLSCLLTGTFFVFSQNNFRTKNLVYCPLQKIYVNSLKETQSLLLNPLNQICMKESEKEHLKLKISLKRAFAIDEKGIFEVFRRGEKVFKDYQDFPPSPPSQNFVKIKFAGIGNFKNEFHTTFIVSERLVSFIGFARPPTFSKVIDFEFQPLKNLENISRKISPRSPPFSI